MSSSDMIAFNDLLRRIEVLESRVDLLARSEKSGDKDMMREVYGDQAVDHSEDRAVRAALVPEPKPKK